MTSHTTAQPFSANEPADERLSLPVRIARALIRCPSVTPQEGGALAYLEEILGNAGFEVHRPTFQAPGTPDVQNLFAKIGSGAPHIAFAGHTDVVPPGDAASWQYDPFSGAIAGGMLHGRGAADMKGGVAAFVAAALDFVASNPGGINGTISFLITGDEEGPATNGTVKLMQWCAQRGEHFDACIVGEPTNPKALGDAIKVGRRGSLSGTLTVIGTQGHVAYPHLADNPMPGLLRLVSALDALVFDEGSEHFQPTNLEIVSLDTGNPAFNVIPEKVSARFNVRFNDIWTRQNLADHIDAVLREAAGSAVRFELQLRKGGADCFLTNDADLIEALSAAIETELGCRAELSTGGGTSDARFIKDYCPVVEFGLVGATMHRVDECVPLDDIDRLSAVYRRFLNSYLGSNRKD